ncbi:MAG: hypothetical protein QGF46_00410 [Planctomycetota bacterium]|jgi:hypothetical protein|nr:hypothetical protein [Planctomycetota bacterium]
MHKSERLFNHGANLLIGGSGVIYFWMLYIIEGGDDFSILNHPLQDDIHNWHIVLAPIAVFAVGMLLKSHVLLKLRSKYQGPGRASGLALCALFVPMVLSAYLLQVSTSEEWHSRLAWAHNIFSFLWIFSYLFHQLRIMRR